MTTSTVSRLSASTTYISSRLTIESTETAATKIS